MNLLRDGDGSPCSIYNRLLLEKSTPTKPLNVFKIRCTLSVTGRHRFQLTYIIFKVTDNIPALSISIICTTCTAHTDTETD